MTFPSSSLQFKHENCSKRRHPFPCSPLEYLPKAARQDWTSITRSQSHTLAQAFERNRLLDTIIRKKLAKKTGIHEPRIQVSSMSVTPNMFYLWYFPGWVAEKTLTYLGLSQSSKVKVWDGKHLTSQVAFLQNEKFCQWYTHLESPAAKMWGNVKVNTYFETTLSGFLKLGTVTLVQVIPFLWGCPVPNSYFSGLYLASTN